MSSSDSTQSTVVTSFRKKQQDSLNIRGTRISVQNSQLLTSTGSATLDFFLGGGLAIGTVFLIEEDRFNTYSTVLLKYFLAEGVANNHCLFLSSGDKSSQSILSELPSFELPDTKVENKDSNISEDLKIAWRYQNKATAFSSDIKVESHNHRFDLSKHIPGNILQTCSISSWDPSDSEHTQMSSTILSPSYSILLEQIKSRISSGKFETTNTSDNVLRIGISSIGSPLFNCADSKKLDVDLCRFFYFLKGILRKSYAVALVTVPSYIVQDQVLQTKIRQICDSVVNLESFVGSDKKSNPLFKEFDGLLKVAKLPVLNTFVYPSITSDLAFKLKRRNFVIERLHLPPDFEESQSDTVASSCSGKPSKLDF